jgi:deoxyribose-phosphate aldolase
VDIQKMVDAITREVMQNLKVEGPAPSSGRVLVVCGPEEAEDSSLAVFLKAMEPMTDVTWLVPRSLRGRLSSTVMRGGAPVLALEENPDISGLIEECSCLEVGVLSLGALASLALFMDREPMVRLVLKALFRGREVKVHPCLPPLTPAVKKRADSYIGDLISSGMAVAGLAADESKGPVSRVTEPRDGKSACAALSQGECSACGHCASLVADRVGAVVSAGASRVSSGIGMAPASSDVGKMIDHTLLKADATRDEVIKLCDEARKYDFASVCINPSNVKLASECLRGSPVKVCTVIGFPLGATTSMTKAMETRDAIANGASEIDMVINVGSLKAGNYELVRKDIEAVIEAAQGALVKVIIETALLTDEEKVTACLLARDAGADFVKTSTGFGPGGATAHDVALMRQTVGQYMGVKASGGIRDLKTAQEMIQAGATRIGASASVAIVKGGGTKPEKGY